MYIYIYRCLYKINIYVYIILIIYHIYIIYIYIIVCIYTYIYIIHVYKHECKVSCVVEGDTKCHEHHKPVGMVCENIATTTPRADPLPAQSWNVPAGGTAHFAASLWTAPGESIWHHVIAACSCDFRLTPPSTKKEIRILSPRSCYIY